MRGHSEVMSSRMHAVIYRILSSKHRKADGQRKRKRRLLVITIQPHSPQVSIICKKHSFEETISHMKFDKRQDAAMYETTTRPTSHYFYGKQERRLAVQTRSD
jgi:hypothetical protein